MIKIKKVFVFGGEIGVLPMLEEFYLYKGLDTKNNIFAEVIAKKSEVDGSKQFEKQIKDRIKYVLKNKIGLVEDCPQK